MHEIQNGVELHPRALNQLDYTKELLSNEGGGPSALASPIPEIRSNEQTKENGLRLQMQQVQRLEKQESSRGSTLCGSKVRHDARSPDN
jgi:hypothetical protein